MLRIATVLGLLGGAQALELTPDTWDANVAGKSVFVKFLAPWCGHCKKMKPDWDKLMKEFKDNSDVLIADVDCTAAGQPLCETHGVRGYPTIKYGDPNALEDYSGGRDFASLQKFAKDLKPSCSPFNMDLCEGEAKTKIEELMALSSEDLDSKIAESEKEIADAEELFKSEVEKLQKKYEELSKEKTDTVTKVKESGLGLMKSVKAKAAKDAKEKDGKKDEL